MSKGLGRTQEAVLADLVRRRDAGEHPLTTRHVEGFTSAAISRAYRTLADRGHIELWYAQMCRRGHGMIVELLVA